MANSPELGDLSGIAVRAYLLSWDNPSQVSLRNDAHRPDEARFTRLRQTLCPWMKLPMNAFEAVGIDMGVNLGGGDIGMTEHFLNDSQRRAVGQQVAGKGVSQ